MSSEWAKTENPAFRCNFGFPFRNLMKVLPVLFLSTFVAAVASAEDITPDGRPLSLEQCVVIALQHNFDIQINRYNPRIANYNLYGAYGAYDPVFSFSGEHDYNLSPGGIDSQGRTFSGTETDSDRFSTGLQGLLPWGLSYNLGGNLTDQTGNRPGTIIDPGSATVISNTVYSGGLPSGYYLSTNYSTLSVRSPFETTSGRAGALTLSQPLLKNFWIDATRLTIFVNRRELKKSEIDFLDQAMATITAVEQAYFDLVYAEENVTVQQKALELADRLLAENKKRVEVGALAPLDEKQAESQVASSRADLLSAEAQRDTQQRVLKGLLSDSYTNQWADVKILPTDKLVAVPESYDLQESWRNGLARGPRYRLQQLRLTIEENALQIRYRRNQLFPELDAIGSYGYNASSREFSGALDQIQNRDNPFWSVGAQVSVPLSQTTARNNLKAARAVKDQSTLVLKQNEQNTLIQIENDIANAKSSFERVSATREARLYAESALDAEEKKLANGKSTSFVVLQLQKNVTSARSAEIQALADYNIALAQLAYDEGKTLEKWKVDVNWR